MREDTPGDKRLVAYVVTDKPPSVSEWRHFLQARLPDYMVPSAFVALAALPLTANGKVDRSALPMPAVTRETAAVAPHTEDERRLADIFAEVLHLPQVGIHDNFFELGGDSILAIQIVARARARGLRFTPRQLFEQPTIAGLLAIADAALITAEQGTVTGTAPLTPIQHWFFEQNLVDPQHYNQAVLLTVSPDIDDDCWREIFRQLLTHHDALRLRFFHTDDGWVQTLADPGGEIPYARIDLSAIEPPQRPAAVTERSAEAQASLNLTRGPLLRAVLFDFDSGEDPKLLIVIHHLVVDGVSWRILLEDLDTLRAQLHGLDELAHLPLKTTAFTVWAEKLARYANSVNPTTNSATLREEAQYWLTALPAQAPLLPTDFPALPEANTAGSSRTIAVSLNTEETAHLLRDVARTHQIRIDEMLLTAMALAFARWTGAGMLLVDLEGHGREALFDDVDLSRTVGWFTTIFPVALDVSGCTEPITSDAALRLVKQRLRAIPRHGIGYGLLRYISGGGTGELLQALPQPQVSFNYLGQFEYSADPAAGKTDLRGSAFSEHSRRRYLIDVNGGVFAGQLNLSWIYSEAIHRRTTIESLASTFIDELRKLITHCLSFRLAGLTPMDFPLANLDQAQLDGLLQDNPDLEDIYPLSPMQEGMLFHTLLDPDSGVYVEQLHHSFASDVDMEAFEESWRRVAARHPVLRTTFHWRGLDVPVQVVHREVRLEWVREDWSELSTMDRMDCKQDQETDQQLAHRLDEYLDADRRRGFDLSKAPPMRIALIHTGGNRFEFIWSHHHAILDGWSVPILFSEIGNFYEAIRHGLQYEPSPLRPYREYIAWLQEQDRDAARNYWKRVLHGFTAATSLTVDRPHKGAEGHGERHTLLSAESTVALESFARANRITLNTLVQAAWALLLSRYSGETDVVFGVIVSGRPEALPGVESMLGLFINALPLRVSLPEKDTKKEDTKKDTERNT